MSATAIPAHALPRVGMLATVRNRQGLISAVEPGPTTEHGRVHLVRVEYFDSEGPPEETLAWEREPGARVLEPTALPRVGEVDPMPGDELDALVRATRWGALTPFLPPNVDEPGAPDAPAHALTAPFFGAVQVDDFQLVPLLKALAMPRVSLLLADDVGLGKTVEAGLILTELLIRRRVRRVLVLTPASLRRQWQGELQNKFCLSFDVVDRAETHALQKRMGLDANPWRTFPRIVTSYHYLRQPDVLAQFEAACRQPAGTVHLPWDLLIVDEAHNLMPSSFGEDSDLARMLRVLSPWFEHKLFLTATPHNGHTRSFSGLLEQLDPVRFQQTSTFQPAERTRIEEVVIRRLKSEINALDKTRGRQERFPTRNLAPEHLTFSPRERALSVAFEAFRRRIRGIVESARTGERTAAWFAIEVLNKRLLSSPMTFADSWFRFKAGVDDSREAAAAELAAARRSSESDDVDDDLERVGRGRHAARTVGAWLRPYLDHIANEVAAVDAALANLGIVADPDGAAGFDPSVHPGAPRLDARFEKLVALVKRQVRHGNAWHSDERLIVFTEYKTTLDDLRQRLKEAFRDVPAEDDGAIRVLYGGVDDQYRKAIQDAFNDPESPVRVLLATDAASEGLNLQNSARFVMHYEVPWNPSRLEQRNGRLDRHGQARDVTVFHFTSEDDADLKFLGQVVAKVHRIREDLGSMGEVFEAAFERRFFEQEAVETVQLSLDTQIEESRGQAEIPRASSEVDAGIAEAEFAHLERLRQHIDLTPQTLKATLDVALGIGVGRPRIDGPDEQGRLRLRFPVPRRWTAVVDETLRQETPEGGRGGLPAVVFDASLFVQVIGGRPVFRPMQDTVLLHVGHPIFRQVLATFARARFPGGRGELPDSRWTVRRGPVPAGAVALVVLTTEELALNQLREPFHHWVRTWRLAVRADGAGLDLAPLPYATPADDLVGVQRAEPGDSRRAADLWLDLEPDVRAFVDTLRKKVSLSVRQRLAEVGKTAAREERRRFEHRTKEIERAMHETTLKRLEEDLGRVERKRARLSGTLDLFDDVRARQLEERATLEKRIRDIEEELIRRRRHFQDLLDRLRVEQARVIEGMLPRRHALQGEVQVFPVAVEIRLPLDTRSTASNAGGRA